MLLDRHLNRYSVRRDDSLKAAMQQMNREKLRILVCLGEYGRLWGVLTPGDVNRWLISEGTHSLGVDVGEVCNRRPFTVAESSEPQEFSRLLEKVAYVPVLDGEQRPVALAMRRHLNKGIRLGDRLLSEETLCLVIAEIGNNHNGSLDLAKRLIDLAVEAGADCAKFQMRDMETLYAYVGSANDTRENLGSQYTLDLLRRFQLSPDELFTAFDHCREVGLVPLCTPWDEASVQMLEDYGMDAYKVSSADLTNHHLLTVLSRTGKPLICSTGMSRENEILQAVELLQRYGSHYVLLHCNSTYPAPFKDIHLAYLDRLRELGECLVGYSGHERDIFVPVAAVARGAKMIEKHFTVDRSMEGNDHKVSLLPGELARMVEGIRQVEAALGTAGARELTQGEMMNRVTLAKSVFINCDLEQDAPIEAHMLTVNSPGQGLQPNRLKELIGRPAPHAMKAGDVFYPADLRARSPQARPFHFRSRWGLPVRYHDYLLMLGASNPELLEFHLSYKDLELNHESFFSEPLPVNLVVHAPELFAGDHTLDLTSSEDSYRQRSLNEMLRVIEVAKSLRRFFRNADRPIGIITNVGGFSFDAPLSRREREDRKETLKESLLELSDEAVEIWPQTMPPFPWHFGGQRYHNLFVESEEIADFCRETGVRICLDVSHSKLACNFLKLSFQQFLEQVLPYTAHLHIADARGVDGEGLQIGDGDVDFYALAETLQAHAPEASWIPETWQGHENRGEGFWAALNSLEKFSF